MHEDSLSLWAIHGIITPLQHPGLIRYLVNSNWFASLQEGKDPFAFTTNFHFQQFKKKFFR